MSYLQKAYKLRYEALQYKNDKRTLYEFLDFEISDPDLIKFVNRLLVENKQQPLEKVRVLDVLEAIEVEEINAQHRYLKARLYNVNGRTTCEKVVDRQKYRPILIQELFEEFEEEVLAKVLKKLNKDLDEMTIEQIWDLRSNLRETQRKSKKGVG